VCPFRLLSLRFSFQPFQVALLFHQVTHQGNGHQLFSQHALQLLIAGELDDVR
jgi:hypothetical protein